MHFKHTFWIFKHTKLHAESHKTSQRHNARAMGHSSSCHSLGVDSTGYTRAGGTDHPGVGRWCQPLGAGLEATSQGIKLQAGKLFAGVGIAGVEEGGLI